MFSMKKTTQKKKTPPPPPPPPRGFKHPEDQLFLLPRGDDTQTLVGEWEYQPDAIGYTHWDKDTGRLWDERTGSMWDPNLKDWVTGPFPQTPPPPQPQYGPPQTVYRPQQQPGKQGLTTGAKIVIGFCVSLVCFCCVCIGLPIIIGISVRAGTTDPDPESESLPSPPPVNCGS